MVTAFGDECVKKYGTRIFFCSDEMYICAQRELPDDDFYEEHTQLENGVGMIRLLEREFRGALSLSEKPDGVPFSIAECRWRRILKNLFVLPRKSMII